jgi:hypothetical protein
VTGNPFLLPSKIYKEELTYLLKNRWIFQVTHSKAANAFASLTYTDSVNSYDKQTNYGVKDLSSMNITYSNRFKPFWFFRITTNLSYIKFSGQYNNSFLEQASLYPTISMIIGITISKEKKLYTTLNISNSFEHYSTNVVVRNQFQANLGFNKSSKDDRVQIAVNISDIFRTSLDNYVMRQTSVVNTQQYYYDARAVSISLKYAFGKKTIPKVKDHTKSNSEEKERISNQ